MKRIEPGHLVELRFKTGLTQSVIAANIGCHRTTVVRWEETGKIQDSHYAALLQLVNDIPGAGTTLMKPLGRPQKSYKLRPQRNDKDEHKLDLRYFLWMQGNPDHGWEIWSPPVGEHDNWLERHMHDPQGTANPLWFRWERGANMTEKIVSVLLGPSRTQIREEHAYPFDWEYMKRNPRHFTNYERPDNWETLIRATAEKDGYAMPDLSLIKQITKP